MNLRQTATLIAAGSVTAIAPIGVIAANTAGASTAHTAVVKTTATPSASMKVWAEGTYRAGQTITVDALGFDKHGTVFDHAKVYGPVGITGTLTPAADAGHLTGDIRIPAHVTAGWIRLNVVAPNGRVSYLTIHASSKGASPKTAPVKAAPKTTAASKASSKVWAEGTYRAGQSITIDADGYDCHGVAIDRAKVIGPVGITGTLTPAADAGHLTGDIRIPAHVTAGWIRLTVVMGDGTTNHLVIHRG